MSLSRWLRPSLRDAFVVVVMVVAMVTAMTITAAAATAMQEVALLGQSEAMDGV